MYEFFCSDCNTIYTFLSKSVNTEKTPSCPKCNKKNIQRMVSRFSVTGSLKKKEDGESPIPDLPVDESRME